MLYPASELLFSAGAVIFDKTRTSVLAIVSKNDQRGVEEIMFPKGRLEKDETPEAAAVREVLEETGARCTLWPGLRAMETRHSKAISKTKVVYWYAGDLVAMGEQMLESHEKLDVRWVDVGSAASVLSFENDRELLAICLEALADGQIGEQAT
ncbi:NUDIX hydrolase [Coemansia sp. RSA 2703]|nr:NUDIX hydrolase [Coemansia sp. RSA 2703]KAJ2364077.1 putative mutator protein MutT4 [Coemansia sp. RSA 2607]KAJ2382644.1 putative mutator protein MutT4 [Coemansia sp. RSA 2603]